MGILFLGSRSSLGTRVLVFRPSGPARELSNLYIDSAGRPLTLEWGPSALTCRPLAESLITCVLGGSWTHDGPHADALTHRLETCVHDNWILTEADVLARMTLIV
jgi:hypothetical protein